MHRLRGNKATVLQMASQMWIPAKYACKLSAKEWIKSHSILSHRLHEMNMTSFDNVVSIHLNLRFSNSNTDSGSVWKKISAAAKFANAIFICCDSSHRVLNQKHGLPISALRSDSDHLMFSRSVDQRQLQRMQQCTFECSLEQFQPAR